MLYRDDIPKVEVGVELIAPCALAAPVIRSGVPASEPARIVHRGPYQDLGAAHGTVRQWCAAAGRDLGALLGDLRGLAGQPGGPGDRGVLPAALTGASGRPPDDNPLLT